MFPTVSCICPLRRLLALIPETVPCPAVAPRNRKQGFSVWSIPKQAALPLSFSLHAGEEQLKTCRSLGPYVHLIKQRIRGTCVYGTNVLQNSLIDGRKAIWNAVSACNPCNADFFLSSTITDHFMCAYSKGPIIRNTLQQRLSGFRDFLDFGSLSKKSKFNNYKHLLTSASPKEC